MSTVQVSRQRWFHWGAAALALVAVTTTLLALRPWLDRVHVALVYLLVVLGGSAADGRTLGVVLSVAAFLAFNFFFIPPYHTFVIANAVDWLVLATFLITGLVAAQLLYRSQTEATVARRRALEVDRLAALGAETLSAGRTEEALTAIARAMQTTLGVRTCDIWVRDADTAVVSLAAHAGDGPSPSLPAPRPASAQRATGVDATTDGEARTQLIPLVVRGRPVGILCLSDDAPIALDPTQQRYLDALAHYAALGLERGRLAAEADRAEALRATDRLKDALLASVSHDIRTPLTTIRALAHDIAAGGDERALVIEEEVDRLNRFVADLLDLSRLKAGGVPLTIALNAAEDLMGAALQRIGGVAIGREIRASLDTTEPVLVGRFDFTQSLRILGNLLENALKYAPHDAPIDFAVRRAGGELVFSVADRGPGIPAAEETRIFEAFYRPLGAAGVERESGGAGLGLAIARGLAAAQGGAVTYDARPGGGSVFSLHLPAADLVPAADFAPAGDEIP